ncbi:MAG TPA: acyl-CoA dehydrogenase family protein [Methylomirabilota bacterium]|nr:acyl-CoA dehydrogenase family protein [Methylomirabilota bacterium]
MTPPAEEYVERARALAPTIAGLADQIERDRRLPDTLVKALHAAGLFRLLLPRSLDGAELDPATFVRVTETLGAVDASTAWCVCQTAGCSTTAAYLGPRAAREIFGGEPCGVLAWGPPTTSKAVVTEGGYRLSGRWSFASGGHHASWLGGQAPIVHADGEPRRRADGVAERRTLIFPAAAATRHDVWHVLGLRGTGSDAFSVQDLFVPHEHTVSRDDPAERQVQAPLYCFPAGSLYASGFAGVALGLARTVLDAFVTLAGDKTARGHTRPLRESPVVQAQVAQAEARLGSARVFLLDSLERIWREVGRAGALGLDQRITIRLAASHAIQQARGVVDDAYHAAGATAIFASQAFERRFRDIHTISQQLQGRDDHFENVGQFLLGLAPDTSFL